MISRGLALTQPRAYSSWTLLTQPSMTRLLTQPRARSSWELLTQQRVFVGHRDPRFAQDRLCVE